MSDKEILEMELEGMRVRAAEAAGHPHSSESPDNVGEGYGGEISEGGPVDWELTLSN